MSRRFWFSAFALGLILFTALGQTQEKAQDEQGQIQAEQRPAQTLPIPLPVDVIEDEATAEARKRREAEARQREIDNLIAQQGIDKATQAMNEATHQMADYAKYSTWLVGIGTVLLFVTLWLTRQANRAAQAAVDVTRELGQAQVRAYVSWHRAKIHHSTDALGLLAAIDFIPVIKNTGQSPAFMSNLYSYLAILDLDESPTVEFDSTATVCNDEIGASDIFEMHEQWLTVEQARDIFDRTQRGYLMGWGSYRHKFSLEGQADETFSFCYEIGFRAAPETLGGEQLSANIRLRSRADYIIAPATNDAQEADES